MPVDTLTLPRSVMEVDSDQDSLKENVPPGSKKQMKRKTIESSSEGSEEDETPAQTSNISTASAKRSKLDTAEEILINSGILNDDSDSESSEQTPVPAVKLSGCHSDSDNAPTNRKRRTKQVLSDSESDSNSSKIANKKAPDNDSDSGKSDSDNSSKVLSNQKREGVHLSDQSDGSANSSNSSRRKKKRKRTKAVSDSDSSDDEVTLSSGKVPSQRHGSSTSTRKTQLNSSKLDTDLYDAEESSENDEDSKDSNGSEEEEETTHKLSSKFSGPASKKESKSAKRAAKVDEKLKIYSEKQRMLREQEVTVPVYQPPKKSLREFLSEQAPQLLAALRTTSNNSSTKRSKLKLTSRPSRPPKYIEEMPDNPLLYTPVKVKPLSSKLSEDSNPTASSVRDKCIGGDKSASEDEDLPDLISEITGRKVDDVTGSKDNNVTGSKADDVTGNEADDVTGSKVDDLTGRKSDAAKETFKEEDNDVASDSQTIMGGHPILPDTQSEGILSEEAKLLNSAPLRQLSSQSAGTLGYSSLSQADDTQSMPCPPSTVNPLTASSVTVTNKKSPRKARAEAKKNRLRRLLGDSVDLDIVPQLSCNADGLVVFDDQSTEEQSQFDQFKESFQRKTAKAKQLEEEKKKREQVKALRVVTQLADGSQHELSMDAYSNKTAEETGGVHKLAVLKQILKAKLAEKRGEELKKKTEMMKMEALEEELPEDEILDEDYEFSDEEAEDEEGSVSPQPEDDDDDIGPVLAADEESICKSQMEQDVELMRRVKAVLDSDEEEESQASTKESTLHFNSLLANNHTHSSLDRILDDGITEETTQGVDDSTNQMPAPTSATEYKSSTRRIDQLDDNAQDPNSLFAFSSNMPADSGVDSERPGYTDSGGRSGGAGMLGFTQDMFNTQQAEDEIVGLCSGQFGSTQSQSPSSKLESPPETVAAPTPPTCEDTNTVVEPVAKTKVKSVKKQALQFSDEEKDSDQSESSGDELEENGEVEGDDLDELADTSDEEVGLENEELTVLKEEPAKRELVLHKVRQTKREKLLGEYLDKEAELSGDEAGSDEDLDLGEEGDVLELEQGDLDYLGKEEQLRSEIAKAHAKQRLDDDARELMLMKEMLLPDGDLHSDSRRQRKFRWRHVEYSSVANETAYSDDGLSDSELTTDPEVKHLHERLEKERLEREAWLKEQRDKRVEKELDESQSQLSNTTPSGSTTAGTIAGSTSAPSHNSTHQNTFNLNLSSKRKKPGYILGKSQKYLQRFKELHKNIKSEQSGPISSRNLLFRPISKEDAESQQEMMWKKTT